MLNRPDFLVFDESFLCTAFDTETSLVKIIYPEAIALVVLDGENNQLYGH